MKTLIILLVIFIPFALAVSFAVIQASKQKVSKTMTDNEFTVSLSSYVLYISIFCASVATITTFAFAIFSEEQPKLFFYILMALFLWGAGYLVIKSITFKVVVKDNNITVYSTFKKPYSFAIDEIVSANLRISAIAQDVVVKTKGGKKLVLEGLMGGTGRFCDKIRAEVPKEKLSGF